MIYVCLKIQKYFLVLELKCLCYIKTLKFIRIFEIKTTYRRFKSVIFDTELSVRISCTVIFEKEPQFEMLVLI